MGIEYLLNDKIGAEIIRQNWENARYHESSRWKYTYYFYAALGAFFIYIFNVYKDYRFEIFSFSSGELFLYGIIFLMFALIGYASFYHLLYSNIEYKNHIRAIEFIARDLGVNTNISDYREGDKVISRGAYMALPLMLGIREKMPFTMLTGSAVSIALGFGIFLLTISVAKFFDSQSFLANNHMVIPLSIPALTIGLIAIIKTKEFWKNTEKKAEDELKKRDPQSLMRLCDKTLEIILDHADAWKSKGNALSDLNRYEEAIAAYDKALEIFVSIDSPHVDLVRKRLAKMNQNY